MYARHEACMCVYAHVCIYLLRCLLRLLPHTLPLLLRPFASSCFLVSFLPRSLLCRHLVVVMCLCVHVCVCLYACMCVCVCVCWYVCGVFPYIVMIREPFHHVIFPCKRKRCARIFACTKICMSRCVHGCMYMQLCIQSFMCAHACTTSATRHSSA